MLGTQFSVTRNVHAGVYRAGRGYPITQPRQLRDSPRLVDLLQLRFLPSTACVWGNVFTSLGCYMKNVLLYSVVY